MSYRAISTPQVNIVRPAVRGRKSGKHRDDTVQVAVYLERAEKDGLARLAFEENKSISDILRSFIRDGLARKLCTSCPNCYRDYPDGESVCNECGSETR